MYVNTKASRQDRRGTILLNLGLYESLMGSVSINTCVYLYLCSSLMVTPFYVTKCSNVFFLEENSTVLLTSPYPQQT